MPSNQVLAERDWNIAAGNSLHGDEMGPLMLDRAAPPSRPRKLDLESTRARTPHMFYTGVTNNSQAGRQLRSALQPS